jgi:hypothetical protein
MRKLSLAAAALALTACASVPTGPGVLVLPGTGRNFDSFRADDLECKAYAHAQVGGKTADQAAADNVAKSAVLGTAIGTAAGALLGGHQGAAVGAGVGLAGGALAGSGNSHAAAGSLQQRYDHAFTQCMYAKGHRVPVAGRYSESLAAPSRQAARTPPPPPPPGQPPAEAPPDYRPR